MKLVNINGKAQKEIKHVGFKCKIEIGVSERLLSCGLEMIMILFVCEMIAYFISVDYVSSILLNTPYIPAY